MNLIMQPGCLERGLIVLELGPVNVDVSFSFSGSVIFSNVIYLVK